MEFYLNAKLGKFQSNDKKKTYLKFGAKSKDGAKQFEVAFDMEMSEANKLKVSNAYLTSTPITLGVQNVDNLEMDSEEVTLQDGRKVMNHPLIYATPKESHQELWK